MTKRIVRAMLFFLMIGMGLLTLATGIMLMSRGRPVGGPAPSELAFSAQGRAGFLELHPAVALITVILVVIHLLLNGRAVYSYARTVIPS